MELHLNWTLLFTSGMDKSLSLYKTFQQIQQQAFIFFEILQEMFLAVTNSIENSNAVIYKWKDNQFEKFQVKISVKILWSVYIIITWMEWRPT